MPMQIFPLPTGTDDRDALSLGPDKAVEMFGLRNFRQKVSRLPGSTTYGTGAISGTPRNFFQGFEGSTSLTERLLMLNSGALYVYDDTANTWTIVNAGVGEPDVGMPIGLGGSSVARYSAVNTLNSIFFTDINEAEIYAYNGGAVQRFSTLGYLPTGKTGIGAAILLPFADRVVAVRTQEKDGGGTIDTKVRVRWHIIADVSDWDSDGAGFLDVRDTSDAPIISAGILGERAYILKEREVLELISTGSVDEVFRTETRVAGTGSVCRHSWAAAEQFAFFIGPDDVYVWDGSNIQSVGEPIRKTLFSKMDLQSTAGFMGPDKVQGIIYTARQEYWLLIQGASAPNLFIYDYRRDRWYTDDYQLGGSSASAIGHARIGGSLLLHPGAIPQTEFLLVGRINTLPKSLNEDSQTREGSSFTSRLVTRDFPALKFAGSEITPALDRRNALWEVAFRAVPNATYLCALSVDGGTTFTANDTVSANSDGMVRWFPKPITYNRVRFRIQNVSTAGFELTHQLSYRWSEAGVNYGG